MLVAFAIFDGIWLGIVAPSWYAQAMAPLLRENYISWPWLVFYLGYCMSILVLVLTGDSVKSLLVAGIRGAVLGATAYGAYNLTNYSIIAQWPLSITLIDWAWGTTVTALVAIVGAWAMSPQKHQ